MNEPTLQAAAEQALVAACHAPVRLRLDRRLHVSDRSIVARFRTVAGPAEAPQTIIVKAASGTSPHAAEMVMNEWAATRLLSEREQGLPLCPRLYGGNSAVPLVVLEDLGDGEGSPHELVESDDPEAATASLLSYIREVARLHATTRGLDAAYRQLREDLGSLPSPRPLYHDPWAEAGDRTDAEVRRAIDEYRLVLAGVGVDAPPGLDDEIAVVTRRVECDPGPWLALCQGDQNGLRHCLSVDGRIRLHDFGVAGFRHALIEGLPHRITWGCIHRLPRDVVAAMDVAYRDVLVTADPGLEAGYARAVASALARWHIFHVVWRLPAALERDRPRGPTTLRQQVIAAIDAFVETESERPFFPMLGDAASWLARRLRQLWPTDSHSIPYFPAFRRTACRAG
jgi:hypothetical protein